MSRLRKIIDRKFKNYRQQPDTWVAVLGRPDGIVVVDDANRPDCVYVQTVDGTIVVYNGNAVPPTYGLKVIIGYDDYNKKLLRIFGQAPSYGTTGTPAYQNKANHGPTHSWGDPNGGDDPVYVNPRQVVGGRMFPSSGLTVEIDHGVVQITGGWTDAYGSIDMTSYLPASAGDAVMVLVEIDIDGNYVVTQGTETAVDSISYLDIPAISADTSIPIAAVKLYGGQTVIVDTARDSDITDLRFMRRGGGGGGASLSNILLVNTASVTEYPADDAGMTAALLASVDGDTIYLPGVTITGGPWTVGADITIKGIGFASTELVGEVQIPDNFSPIFDSLTMGHLVVGGYSYPDLVDVKVDTTNQTEAIYLSATSGIAVYDSEIIIRNLVAGGGSDIACARLFANSELLAYRTRFRFYDYVPATTRYLINFDGTPYGDAYLYNCIGIDNISVSNQTGHVYVDNMSRGKDFGIPFAASTSAWDATNYPALHASDLSSGSPAQHNPIASAPGQVPTWDGEKWVAQASSGGVPTTRRIDTTAPLTGGGDLSADRTLAISNATSASSGAMSAADKAIVDKLNALPPIVKDPTGFTDPANVIVTYDPTARTIALTGTVAAYWQGAVILELVSGWTSGSHANANGIYYLSYNGSVFAWNTSPWTFDQLQIAYVNYRGTGDPTFALRETHGMNLPHDGHEILHDTIGCFRESGGTLSGYVPASTTAADRRPAVAETVIHDEDLVTTNPALAAGSYTQMYLASTGVATFVTAAAEIVPVLSLNPYYNRFATPNWTQVLMANNSYMSVWLLAIPASASAQSQKFRYVWVQGQSNGNLASQQALTPASLNLGNFAGLASEFVFLAQVILRYTGGNWDINSVINITGNRHNQVGAPAGLFLSSVEATYPLQGTGLVSDPLTLAAATTGSAGSMSAADKTKLDQFSNGGFTLTVPANGTAALLGTANVFTAVQTVKDYVVSESTNASGFVAKTVTDVYPPYNSLRRSRAGTAILQAGDTIGVSAFDGYDGVDYRNAAKIYAQVDAVPYAGSMPGRLILATTPPGSTASIDRLSILSNGNIGLGIVLPALKLHLFSDNADANMLFEVPNNESYDPLTTYLVGGQVVWNVGVDNSDANKLKIAIGGDYNNFGGGDALVIGTSKYLAVPSGGLHVGGDSDPGDNNLLVDGKFGCNGKAEQASVAVNAASTDLASVVALCNQLRAALVANGICV